MPTDIPFIFGLSPAEPPLGPDSAFWGRRLPSSHRDFHGSGGDFSQDSVTYGDYFSAAQNFLQQDEAFRLSRAISACTDGAVTKADIKQVAIYLVKHGAFYHPALLRVETADRFIPLVLNVAVSSEGKGGLDGEYRNMARLSRELPRKFWPVLYGQGVGISKSGGHFPMFMGQWLEGFHEFHLTAGASAADSKVVVWDTDNGHRMLTDHQVGALFRQAAAILAYTYNPLTFEAIGNWHHAAGDFVVDARSEELQVRLITVRRYGPIISDGPPDVAELLEILLVYFIQISLRLRMDRLDGVGAPVCHSQQVVAEICRGFFQGLRWAGQARGLPRDFAAMARQYIALHGVADLMPIAQAVMERFSAPDAERALMEQMIESHISELAKALVGTQADTICG